MWCDVVIPAGGTEAPGETQVLVWTSDQNEVDTSKFAC